MRNRHDIKSLVQSFVGQLASLVQQQTEARAREVALSAIGEPAAPRRPPSRRRQLQGRYIGMLRRFSGKDRQKVRALYSSQGVEAAIACMQRMAARAN